jgi:phage terminase Nu1 subunit (DNA packaging protein)
MVFAREEGLPRAARGRYPLLEILRWRDDKLAATVKGDSDLTEERRLYVITQRHRQELENRKTAGQLIPADEVANIINKLCVIFASQLDGLAPRLAATLANVDDPGVIAGTIDHECKHIRSAASVSVQEFATTYR